MSRSRALVAVLAAALMAAVTATGLAPAAEASTYRYWVYWIGDSGSWSYSNVGPRDRVMDDGSVDGWRFGRGASTTSVATPRSTPGYAALCPDHPTSEDGIQVAIVVDWGTESDSPGYGVVHKCRTYASRPTGAQLLTDLGYPLRVEGGLVCAIRDYPKPPECGKTVADPKPSPTRSAAPAPAPGTATPGASSGPAHQKWARPERASGSPLPSVEPVKPGSPEPSVGPSATGETAAPSGTPSAQEPGPTHAPAMPVGLIVGTLAVVALGGGAALRARR